MDKQSNKKKKAKKAELVANCDCKGFEITLM